MKTAIAALSRTFRNAAIFVIGLGAVFRAITAGGHLVEYVMFNTADQIHETWVDLLRTFRE